MKEMVVRGEMRGVVVGRNPGQSPGSHTRDSYIRSRGTRLGTGFAWRGGTCDVSATRGIRLCSVPTTTAARRRPPADGRSSATQRSPPPSRRRSGCRWRLRAAAVGRWSGRALPLTRVSCRSHPNFVSLFRYLISTQETFASSPRARARDESKCFLGTQSLVVRDPKFACDFSYVTTFGVRCTLSTACRLSPKFRAKISHGWNTTKGEISRNSTRVARVPTQISRLRRKILRTGTSPKFRK